MRLLWLFLLEEGMHQDLHEVHTLEGLIVKHLGHQILELMAEACALVLLMRLPEGIVLLPAE